MLATAIYAGLRKGELFGLRWTDLALDAGRIDVNRSYRLLPKSGKARHLPIHPALGPILRAWRERCPVTEERLVFPVPLDSGRYRMGARQDSLELPTVLAAAGCHAPAKPWHALRHTFAAHAVMAGASLYGVQRILGHSSPVMTQRYAHLAPDFLAAEVARIAFTAPPAAGIADLAEARRRRAAAPTPTE
jgi:integrase